MTDAADPVVSPADTIRWLAEFFRIDLTPHDPLDWHGNQAEGIAQCPTCVINAALAVGERDKAEREQAVAQTLRIIEKSTRDYNVVVDALDSEREARERDRRQIARLTRGLEQIAAHPHGGILVNIARAALDAEATDGAALSGDSDSGERDRRQIARLTEALREWHEIECGCDRPGNPAACICVPIESAAVLADEEDAGPNVVKDNAPTGGLDSWDF